MSAGAGRHPSDADRAEAARPVLEALLMAVRDGDAAGLGACLDDEVVWLDAAGAVRGREEAVTRLLGIAGRAAGWSAPRQHGAHAVLRWRGPGDSAGGVVVEARRGRVVLVAAPT